MENISNILFKDIVSHLPEGIIVMNRERVIYYMNNTAIEYTGWKVGDSVPYCTYCNQRVLENDENRCLLSVEDPIPFLHSHMPVYSGIHEPFNMSMQKLTQDEQTFFVLRLERPSENEHEEKAKFHQLLIQETMLAQESERKHIARELHDDICQNVYSIFLGLEGIKPFIRNEKHLSHLSNMSRVIEETLEHIKTLTNSLRPEMVIHLGLREALHEAVINWSKLYQVEIELDLELNNEEHYCNEKELNFFRMIQEAVNNAVRHGKANSIKIHLKSVAQYTFFTIYDNGTGFNMKEISIGLGLKHMYERSMILNGDIRWMSNEGESTRVEGFVSLMKDGAS